MGRSMLTRFAAVMVASLSLSIGARAADFDPDLVAKAKQEGSVNFYTVGQLYKNLAEAFEKKFGIKVNVVRGDSQDVVLRLINEDRAGRVDADVITLGGTGIPTLRAANILKPFKLDSSAFIDKKYRDPQDYWAGTVIYIQLPAFNTDQVPEAERPKTYDDLLAPRWKDRLVWRPNDVTGAVGFIGNILTNMGDERGMAYLRKLATQNIKVVNISSFALTNQVGAGEYPVALQVQTNQVELGQQKGGPVAWASVKPVSATFETVALTAKAPHPNAGRLMAEFLLSKDGQAMYNEAFYLPVRRDIPIKTKALHALELNFLTPEIFHAQQDHWIDVFNKVFRK